MSQRKVSKPRTCKTCGLEILSTAEELKDHAKTCVSVEEKVS